MSQADLPLFNWEPPKCEVIPFPAARRVGKVRRTVEVLSTRNGKSADQYWLQVVSGMQSQMASAGLPDEVIDRELRSFAEAVFSRLAGQFPRPGGSAA